MDKQLRAFNTTRKYKNVLLVRNGDYVGLYRVAGDMLKIWRDVNKETYGRCSIEINKKPRYPGLAYKWACNECHLIPSKYNLNNINHLKVLDDCLGGAHERVMEKINTAIDTLISVPTPESEKE